MSAVTVDDLKTDIKPYNYEALCGNDDDIAARALEKATLWAKAKVIVAAGSFDPESEINREIVIKRALYELYSYGENEAVAQDKREDALELLKAAYGPAIDSSGYEGGASSGSGLGVASGSVKGGSRNTSLF